MARLDQLALVTVVYALGVLVAAARGATTRNVLPGLAVLLTVAVAVHYANEYADYETDATTTPTPYSGGSGALRATGLGPAFAGRATAAAVALALAAIACGAGVRGLSMLATGFISIILVVGLAYSIGPRLAWRGFGEVANAPLGGLALPLYGVAVTGRSLLAVDVLTFLPFTAVVFANLLATQSPDRRADERVRKRTLAVELHAAELRVLYATASVLGVGGVVALAVEGVLPALLVGLGVPTAVMLGVGYRRYGRVESPAVTVHAVVALAFGYVVAAIWAW